MPEGNPSPELLNSLSSLSNSTLSPKGRGRVKNSLFTRKKAAFTLAEVLITLGIIGVVAALTLPTLVQNNRNKELETGLKKSYSVLSQAVMMYQAEYGEPINRSNLGGRNVKPILMKYLKSVKDCGRGDVDAETACIPNRGYLDDPDSVVDIYKNINGSNSITTSQIDDGQFVLNDGMLVLIEDPLENDDGRLFISVDVNGYNNRPNRLGQDLFMFQLDPENGKLRPMGAEGTYYYKEDGEYCDAHSTARMNGAACTVRALYDKNYWNNLPK